MVESLLNAIDCSWCESTPDVSDKWKFLKSLRLNAGRQSMRISLQLVQQPLLCMAHSMVRSSTPWQSIALHPLGKSMLRWIHLNVILGWIIANQQMLPSTETAQMEIDKIPKHCRFCLLWVFVCLFNSSKNKSYHIKINKWMPCDRNP